MVSLTINGKTIEVARGTTVLQAANQAGVEIPHYCYHPRLSIAGNCRMCLVEVEKVPKLQTACSTVASDGMVVHTDTERVRKAVTGVLEFLLLNHPVDCPVCDQAGECGLQDYYMKYGLHKSRFALDEKVKKVKAKDIGGLIKLDSERCILCTRCIRFLREVVGTDELNIFKRGSRSMIDIYPGRPLSNRYTCNLADVCPVGALTDGDFRFHCRVWFLSATRSICTGCGRGCNVELHYKQGKVFRVKPSLNDDVNGVWMCDIGRLTYKQMNEGRVGSPYRVVDGKKRESGWDALLYSSSMALADIKKESGAGSTAVIASPRSSNEELYLTKLFATRVLKTPNLAFTSEGRGDSYFDDFLIAADKNPNSRGAREIGIAPVEGGKDFTAILQGIERGEIRALVIFGPELGSLGDEETARLAGKADFVLNITPNDSALSEASKIVLSSATVAEQSGTFTNLDGRVQRFFPAFAPQGGAKKGIWILSQLAGKMGVHFEYKNEEEVFNEIAREIPYFHDLDYASIGYYGHRPEEKV